MAFMLERDAINGKDGGAFLIRNNEVTRLFNIKKLEALAEFEESDFKVVGTRIIQVRTNGVKYTGTLNYYYGTPIFLNMLIEYQDRGVLPYFNAQVTNDDKTATVGKQVVELANCKFSKIPITMLDADSNELQCDTGFSFTRVNNLEDFRREPENFG